MNFLIIGDLHIGKNLFTITPNPYNSLPRTAINKIYSLTTIDYVLKICEECKDIKDLHVVFLGDLFDTAYDKEPWYSLIEDMLSYICCINESWTIHILVGNHDSRSYIGNMECTPLTSFISNRVHVYGHPANIIFDDCNALFLPYRKRHKIEQSLFTASFELNIDKNKRVLIFSHNDIYMESSLWMASTLSKERIEEILNTKDVYIFNGHIHAYHYETGFYLLGAVPPTSFKYKLQASGICLYNTDDKVKMYKNVNMFFMSMSNVDYLYKTEQFLEQAREHKALVLFRPPSSWDKHNVIFNKYKDVIIGADISDD